MHQFQIQYHLRLFASAVILTVLAMASAQAQDDAPPPQISEKVGTVISKLAPLIESKEYATILSQVEPLLADDIGEYDRAVLLQIKAQVLLNQGNLSAAIEPMEGSLSIADRYGYFDETLTREFLYFLCQLYYQQAMEANDAFARGNSMDKAHHYLKRWLSALPEPTEESQLFASSLLYAKGTLDPENPDMETIAEAENAAEQGLRLSVQPEESLYMVLLSTAQLQGNWEQMADLLELVIERNPENKTYWQQLLGVYLTLAGQADKKSVIQDMQLRAVLTIERAQQRGFMTESENYFNLVGLYINLQQFRRAAKILQAGLVDGQIEDTPENRELLASSWQQAHEEEQAIAALEDAIERFPEQGQPEYQLAQIYYQRDESDKAYDHLKLAVEKGKLKSLGQAYLFLCYLDYDNGDFAQASHWIEAAKESGDAAEKEIVRLEVAINEAQKSQL